MRCYLVVAGLLLLATPVFGVTYIDDDFLPDEDMNGWTTYGDPVLTNPPGNGFSLWVPCYLREDEQVGIAGYQQGGNTSGGFGMYKQYTDQDIPGESTTIRVWVRSMTCDWNWNLKPDAITVRVGVDQDGGTDPAGVDVWGDPYWGDWSLSDPYELVLPEVSGTMTIFIDFQGGNNGYSQGLIDRVFVFEGGFAPGDLDEDGDVDEDDFATFSSCFGASLPDPACDSSDLDGDSDVDCDDFQIMYDNWTNPPPPQDPVLDWRDANCPCVGRDVADIDCDGDVDTDDFNTLDGCFSGEGNPTSCTGQDARSDIDGDTDVDCDDFMTLVDHWTVGDPPSSYSNCPCYGAHPADVDCDGDIDIDDYNTIAGCYTGSGNPITCEYPRADTDGDNDVDCIDYNTLVEAWTGPPEDPPSLAACESIGCPLSNGGFETGDMTDWTAAGIGVESWGWFCGYNPAPGNGDYYAGAARNGTDLNASLYRIVDVTNAGGTSLSIDFSCYYLLAFATASQSFADQIHMVWEIGYRDDQRAISGPDDPCLTWVELLNVDGTSSMVGDGWCDGTWVYTGPIHVDLSDLAGCVPQVILRMRAWIDQTQPGHWAFAMTDEVELCVEGTGGGCDTYNPADLDQDGDTDQDDVDAFSACFTGSGGGVPGGCELADLDCDNDVDCDDWDLVKANWDGTPPDDIDQCKCVGKPIGDLDCDGDVDDDDVTAFQSCFGTTPGDPWTPCGRADIDGDNDIDCQDYGNLRTGYILSQGSDPGLIPECPWCDTALSNGSFENGAFAPEWSASGANVEANPLWACGFTTPFGTYFAGNVTNGGSIDWTMRRVIDVADAGGNTLDVELRAFYLMTASDGDVAHPERVTQTWTLYVKNDGSNPSGPDDVADTTAYQLATYDGTLSMTGPGWCNGKWAYVETVVDDLDISPVEDVQQVILEVTSQSSISIWTFSYVDNVDCCISGGVAIPKNICDYNRDGVVDDTDVTIFFDCYSGPGGGSGGTGGSGIPCSRCDVDGVDNAGDNDVDLIDFATLQANYGLTGPM